MSYTPKIRRHGQHIIDSRLLRSLNDKDIEALDELIKAGAAGILSIELRDKIELGGQPAPYIRHLRLADFRISTEDKALHPYRGTMRVCCRYILQSVPHKSMLPAVELVDQPEAVAAVAVAPVAGTQLTLDLLPQAANEHTGPAVTGGVAI